MHPELFLSTHLEINSPKSCIGNNLIFDFYQHWYYLPDMMRAVKPKPFGPIGNNRTLTTLMLLFPEPYILFLEGLAFQDVRR